MGIIELSYFYIGAICGSFLNVIIYRLPNSQSIVTPRSHCIHCNKHIPFYHNIPIISFLILFGKCNNCNKRISIQYPLVEIITGVLFLYLFTNFYFYHAILLSIILCLFLCIAIIDFFYYIIPLELIIINFVSISIFTYYFSSTFSYHLFGMVIGFSYLCFIFCLTWIFSKKQPMGYGDFLLIIILGLFVGPFKILLGIFFASILGLFYWLFLILINGYEKNIKLPFGTFLIIASISLYLFKINFNLFTFF